MTSQSPEGRRPLKILLGALAGVLALALAWALWGMGNRSEPNAVNTPSPSAPVTPSTPSPTAPPTSSTPSASATTTPTASKSVSPYCAAYAKIVAGGKETTKDEGGLDFAKMSATYADLIDRYSKAAKLAPAQLKDDYAKALTMLRDMKAAADAKDFNQLREMFKKLGTLNATLDSISKTSTELCG